MFPPSVTENPEAWLNAVWESLQRAGDHYAENAELLQDESGFVGFLYLKDSLPPGVKRDVSQYIKKYSRLAGWAVRSVSFRRDYIRIEASSAESSFTKKR